VAFIITIDGPSGSGKGTVSRAVAKALGFSLLDSGALYRLVALAGLKAGLSLDDGAALARLARQLDIRFGSTSDGSEQIWLCGEDVTQAIRTEEAGNNASKVAALIPVREALLGRQRRFAENGGLVADGRDMGTVVFPDASLKIFLVADAAERAQRRYKQLKEKGVPASLADLSQEIAERDRRDANRSVAPLVASSDAVLLDSTHLSVDEVVAKVLSLAKERIGK
jgi:cytidylate kinase